MTGYKVTRRRRIPMYDADGNCIDDGKGSRTKKIELSLADRIAEQMRRHGASADEIAAFRAKCEADDEGEAR